VKILNNNTLEVVSNVDLQKYLGKWYEIGRLPTSFQEGCSETTATYSLLPNGKVSVLNQCIRKGKPKTAKGKAKVVDGTTNAKLKVTFFWPFYADYWIIKLGENYDYAVVGTPDHKYLWILCRAPQMREMLLLELVEFAKSRGFDMDKLIRTRQTFTE
jgi:apolipoprotein D and lipocalin family protein